MSCECTVFVLAETKLILLLLRTNMMKVYKSYKLNKTGYKIHSYELL